MNIRVLLPILLVPVAVHLAACSDDSSSSSGTPSGGAGSNAGGSGGSGTAGSEAAGSGGSGPTAGSGGSGQAGSGTAGSGAGGAGGSGQAGSGTAGGGGSEAAGSGGEGQGGQGGSSKQGFLQFGVAGLTEIQGLPNPIYSNLASASFTDASTGGNSSCTIAELGGGCRSIACDLGGGSGNSVTLSAGDIVFTGGAVSPVTLKLKEIPNSTVLAYQGDPALPTDQGIVAGGETIEAKASGGDVPAFSIQATTPKPLKVTGFPVAPSPGASVDMDTSTDFSLQVSGDSSGDVLVYAAASENNKSLTVVCSTPVSFGGVTIKASALQALKAAGSKGTLLVSQSISKSISAGDWSITLSTSNYLQDAAGKPLTYYAQTNWK